MKVNIVISPGCPELLLRIIDSEIEEATAAVVVVVKLHLGNVDRFQGWAAIAVL